MDNPEVRTVDDEIRLVDVLITENETRLADGLATHDLDKIARLVKAAQEANQDTIAVDDIVTALASTRAYNACRRELAQLTVTKAKLIDTRTRQLAAHAISPADIGRLMVDIQTTLAYILTPDQQRDFQRRVMAANPLLSYVPGRTP